MAFNGEDEIPMITSPRSKQLFFANSQSKHKELSKSQREYKTVLSMRLKKRSEHIIEKSYAKAIRRLQQERNDIRAQIFVANARCYRHPDQKYLEQIECHVKCQERLSTEISNFKKLIQNLQRERGRVDKQIYELNRKTVADSQHQEYVAEVRKKIQILENRVETGVRNECGVLAANTELKENIKTMLIHRRHFNNCFKNYLQKLIDDKKYLMDLMEYATQSYEGCIEMLEKNINTKIKTSKESEQAKFKVQSIVRSLAAAELAKGFMDCKNKVRSLANLLPAEVKRRKKFKHDHLKSIKLYNTVLAKIFEYTQSHNVTSVIEKFQQHETLYHSYFNYANRTSFHLTSLETTLDHLFEDIKNLRQQNRTLFSDQHERISELQLKLEEVKERNANLDGKCLMTKKQLDSSCKEIANIFEICLADATPLVSKLGNYMFIDMSNFAGFMRILEERILHIVRNVYIKERTETNEIPDNYVVRDVEKRREEPTKLNDIVLTQECPECAEGEILNNADGGKDNIVEVMSIASVKKKLFEEVNQPDIQYRLHSISQCRLPKSRFLAAKRHT